MLHISVQFSSVTQSCPTLCDPINHSTPGLPVHHQIPGFTQTQHPKTHINQINEGQTEQILKAARENEQITHKGIPIRITADLSIETLQARREWQSVLKVIKKNRNPLQCSGLENSMDRSLVGYSPQGHRKVGHG